jgi:hypothetical protein
VEDTRCMLMMIPRWRCRFVHREANEVAHRLAKAAITYVNDRIWRDYTPYCISDVVLIKFSTLSS